MQPLDVERLHRYAQEWIDRLKQFGELYAVARPRALLLKGQLDMLGGRRSRALRHFHKAVSIASRLGMAYERALSLVELGKGASSDYEKARLFQAALDLFARAGASFDEERCAQFLRDLGINPGAEAGGRRRSLGSRGGDGDEDGGGGAQMTEAPAVTCGCFGGAERSAAELERGTSTPSASTPTLTPHLTRPPPLL
eukprot:CAMPEP_0185321798 /NCGR_PEP_ID=MMETSP1363-20130426/57963_1 /TAXON_ID=38817 /ORGANISM="Gephyrocapsa oceanica, Strain RCC1303" /LENGTH=196 /DNA_ID=CAMNT_0027920309 /DNA_START=1 /DNA_END=591 /DNA_ORIENTATION=-